MRYVTAQSKLVAAVLLTIGILVVAPTEALAARGSDDSSSKKTETTSTNSSNSTSSTNETTESSSRHSGTDDRTTKIEDHSTSLSSDDDSTHHAVGDDNTASHLSELKSQAKQLVGSERQNKKSEKSVEVRQKVCTSRKTSLTDKQSRYVKAATNHKAAFDAIYTKVVNYQTSHNLTNDDITALKATAAAQQQAAADAIATLNSVTIDCASTDPATEVATLKASVTSTRAALQDYRTAIKNLVVALKKASTNTTEAN